MHKNTEGLKRSARLRSEAAMVRTKAALQRMDTADQEINFRAVASEARVSTAWLYAQQELRERIMRLRTSQAGTRFAEADQPHESLSRRNIIATLKLRIKRLEERNRELTELLEHAYGVIVQTSGAKSDITSGSLESYRSSD